MDPQVFVFRTNVRGQKNAKLVCQTLEGNEMIQRATLDLEDTDKVLRVEADIETPVEITAIVQNLGFQINDLY